MIQEDIDALAGEPREEEYTGGMGSHCKRRSGEGLSNSRPEMRWLKAM